MKTTQNDATTAYRNRAKQIAAHMAGIKALLADYDAEQAKRPNDWGFAGSLGHVEEQLGEIRTFLSGS